METLKLVTLLLLVFQAKCDILHHHLIESPKLTNWGSWGELESCPVGTFVTGMQLKVEPAEGWKDDTGLNGIRLFCSRLGPSGKDESPAVISSSVGPFGEWRSIFRCEGESLNPETSAVVGFQLRTETPNKMKDDTSANNFRIFCKDLAENQEENEDGGQEHIETDIPKHLVLEGDGTGWGTWTDSQLCRNGYAICGIATQVDHGHFQTDGYDDTGLNNVRAECCKIRFHNRDFHEERERPHSFDDNGVVFPDPIESARNLQKALLEMQTKGNLETTPAPEPPTSRSYPPLITVPEVLQVDEQSTDIPHPSPKLPIPSNHSDSEDIFERYPTITNYDFPGRPKVPDFQPADEIPLNNDAYYVPIPIVPPEVVQELETGFKATIPDQDPIIKNSTTVITPTPSPKKNTGHKDSEGLNNLLLIASGSPNFHHFCIPIGLYSMFFLAFFANYVLL